MSKTISLFAVCVALSLSPAALAQGTVGGAERGAASGDRAAGPVGAVVGGAVGAAAGTVNGVAGGGHGGCSSTTVHRENSEGDSSTKTRTDC